MPVPYNKRESICKSIYIRSRRACNKFASTRVFLAVWRRGGGIRYNLVVR
jgi:hypothetical protein